MKFCNVNEWMFEHLTQQGKGTMPTIIVIVVRCCTGLELMIDCWPHVQL